MRSQFFGGVAISDIAKHFRVSRQAVWKWIDEGIPPGRVIAFSYLLSWRYTPHQLRPDIYPNPWDGLPPHVLKKNAAFLGFAGLVD